MMMPYVTFCLRVPLPSEQISFFKQFRMFVSFFVGQVSTQTLFVSFFGVGK